VLLELNIYDPMQRKFIYYSFFVLLSSKSLFKKLLSINRSQFHFNIIENSKLYVVALVTSQVIMSYFLTGSIFSFIISVAVLLFFFFIYSKLGFCVIPIMFIYYLEGMLLKVYLPANFSENEISLILLNFKLSNLSLLLSIIFIIIVYYEAELVRIYYLIFRRIFFVKILFDSILIVNYIYSLYNELENKYLESLFKSYKIVLLFYIVHYVIIYIALFVKLNLKIDELTIDSYFPELRMEVINYDKSTPYYEIKINKVILFLFLEISFYIIIFCKSN